MAFNIKAYPHWQKRLGLAQFFKSAGSGLCRVCDRWCTQPLCENCLQIHQAHTLRCRLCALPCTLEICSACLSHPPLWQDCASAVAYTEPWRGLVIDFKFHENPGLAKFLARVILNNPQARGLVNAADALVPVPVHKDKLRQRGFNPALCLARALAKDRCLDDALVKWRQTRAQSGLDHAQRLSNLSHAITANPSMTRQLKSRHVVLVDDVMTTGSTLHTCAQALFDAGVQRVSCVVLARAEPNSQAQSVLLD